MKLVHYPPTIHSVLIAFLALFLIAFVNTSFASQAYLERVSGGVIAATEFDEKGNAYYLIAGTADTVKFLENEVTSSKDKLILAYRSKGANTVTAMHTISSTSAPAWYKSEASNTLNLKLTSNYAIVLVGDYKGENKRKLIRINRTDYSEKAIELTHPSVQVLDSGTEKSSSANLSVDSFDGITVPFCEIETKVKSTVYKNDGTSYTYSPKVCKSKGFYRIDADSFTASEHSAADFEVKKTTTKLVGDDNTYDFKIDATPVTHFFDSDHRYTILSMDELKFYRSSNLSGIGNSRGSISEATQTGAHVPGIAVKPIGGLAGSRAVLMPNLDEGWFGFNDLTFHVKNAGQYKATMAADDGLTVQIDGTSIAADTSFYLDAGYHWMRNYHWNSVDGSSYSVSIKPENGGNEILNITNGNFQKTADIVPFFPDHYPKRDHLVLKSGFENKSSGDITFDSSTHSSFFRHLVDGLRVNDFIRPENEKNFDDTEYREDDKAHGRTIIVKTTHSGQMVKVRVVKNIQALDAKLINGRIYLVGKERRPGNKDYGISIKAFSTNLPAKADYESRIVFKNEDAVRFSGALLDFKTDSLNNLYILASLPKSETSVVKGASGQSVEELEGGTKNSFYAAKFNSSLSLQWITKPNALSGELSSFSSLGVDSSTGDVFISGGLKTDPDAASISVGSSQDQLNTQVFTDTTEGFYIGLAGNSGEFTARTTIEVDSDFGSNLANQKLQHLVQPATGKQTIFTGQMINVHAPKYIYVDSNGDPLLDTTNAVIDNADDPRAVTRYRCVGVSMQNSLTSKTSCQHSFENQEDTSIRFQWEIDHLLHIQTNNDSLTASANAMPSAGRHWIKLGDSVNLQVDGIVKDGSNFAIRHQLMSASPSETQKTMVFKSDDNSGSEISFSGKGLIADSFTIEGWIKPTQYDLTNDDPLNILAIGRSKVQYSDHGVDVNSSSEDNAVELYFAKDKLSIKTVSNKKSTVLQLDDTLELNKWHHVAATFNNSDKQLSLYLNGKFIEHVTDTDFVAPNNPNSSFIGASSLNQYGSYQIDEFRVWSTARSEGQIKDTMYSTLSGVEEELGLYFDFEDFDYPTYRNKADDERNGTYTASILDGGLSQENQFLEFVPSENRHQVASFMMNEPVSFDYIWKKQFQVEVNVSNSTFDDKPVSTVNGVIREGAGTFWANENSTVTLQMPESPSDSRSLEGWDYGRGDIEKEGTLGKLKEGVAAHKALTFNITEPSALTWKVETKTYKTTAFVGEKLDLESILGEEDINYTKMKNNQRHQVRYDSGVVVDGGDNNQVLDNMVLWAGYEKGFYPLYPGKISLEWFIDDPDSDSASEDNFRVDVDVSWPQPHAKYVIDTPEVELENFADDQFAFTGKFVSDDTQAVSETKFKGTKKGVNTTLVFTCTDKTGSVSSGSAVGDVSIEPVCVRVINTVDLNSVTEAEALSHPIGDEITYQDHYTNGLHSGYVVNELTQYNPNLYDRENLQGQIFPVNKLLSDKDENALQVVWYQPYKRTEGEGDSQNKIVEPVYWPFHSIKYDLKWPQIGDPQYKQRIVIASRIGSDGKMSDAVSSQHKIDPARYEQLKIYNQPERSVAGFNPNEEHAVLAPSLLYGSELPLPKAAFALRNDLNNTSFESATSPNDENYTSEPYVLVEYYDKQDKKFGMWVYNVELEDENTAHDNGDAYTFDYRMKAGELVVAPYPLNVVTGVQVPALNWGHQHQYKDSTLVEPKQNVYWEDHKGQSWAISGNSEFKGYFWYTLQPDFYWPSSKTLCYQSDDPSDYKARLLQGGSGCSTNVEVGDYIPFANREKQGEGNHDWQENEITFHTAWPDELPTLKAGETITFSGGEALEDELSEEGLPGVIGYAAGQIVFDSKNPKFAEPVVNSFSARLSQVVEVVKVPWLNEKGSGENFSDLFPLFPADKIRVFKGKYFFKELSASLQNRVYYDPITQEFVLRGFIDGKTSGDSDLTASPGAIYTVQPNILSTKDLAELKGLHTQSIFQNKVEELYSRSLNPSRVATFGKDELGTSLTKDVSCKKLTDSESGLAANPDYNQSETIEDNIKKGTVLYGVGLDCIGYGNEVIVDWPSSNYSGEGELERVVVDFSQFDGPANVLAQKSNNSWKASFTSTSSNFDGNGKSVVLNMTAIKGKGTSNEEIISATEEVVPTSIKATAGVIGHKSSFGSGLALMPSDALLNPSFVKQLGGNPLYVTIAENNHPDLGSAPVSLHIVKIDPEEKFRGEIDVLKPDNVFDEKVNLRHTADFGAKGEGLIFEWWYREEDGTTPPIPSKAKPGIWKMLADPSGNKGLGMNEVLLSGAGAALLADNLFFARYRHKDCPAVDTTCWSDWAGAANNKPNKNDYHAQLSEGWIKRVVDQVNLFEARISDFYSHESPATYTSMIQQTGPGYNGAVALNADKDVIENTGLIQLYETVLDRSLGLSIDASQPYTTPGVLNALQLSTSRLAQFYSLLGNEAYVDALDPSIGFTTASGEYGSLAPTVHAFQDQSASLLDEELALLRGRDQFGAFPSYNRLLWNFTIGDGEVAYAQNYNISDVDQNGFRDEVDARKLYPQGHGDAWGHYGMALDYYYRLLNHNNFVWQPRSEKVLLDGSAIDVDFHDERRFAEIASARARTGHDILSATYRANYVESPDGQWQGYKDRNTDRAWGVNEWAQRAVTASYFDWLTVNSMIPAEETVLEGIRKVDRTTVPELKSIATQSQAMINLVNNADNGLNPLGVMPEVVPFDIDPVKVDRDYVNPETHFEQVASRAQQALDNAFLAFDFANNQKNRTREVANTAEEMLQGALEQDINYNNRLIEIFGTPYEGTIGSGKIYPAGYDGPDLYYYNYLDSKSVTDGNTSEGNYFTSDDSFVTEKLKFLSDEVKGEVTENNKFATEFKFLGEAELKEIPYRLTAGNYAFVAKSDWNIRRSPGEIQKALQEMLQTEYKLSISIDDYQTLADNISVHVKSIESMNKVKEKQLALNDKFRNEKIGMHSALLVTKTTLNIATTALEITNAALEVGERSLPDVVGLSNDPSAPAEGAFKGQQMINTGMINKLNFGQDIAEMGFEFSEEMLEMMLEKNLEESDFDSELIQMLWELQSMFNDEGGYRLAIFRDIEALRIAADNYRAVLSKGLRLLEEREVFNKQIASKVQGDRYKDMTFRLSHYDAQQKYQAAFDLAAKNVYLAARAYDYETNLNPNDAGSAQGILTDIVRTRSLGEKNTGASVSGNAGLSELLAKLKTNFGVLKGQMGFNNPQTETGRFSLRYELLRIPKVEEYDPYWRNELAKYKRDNLWEIEEFTKYARKFTSDTTTPQPGLVIPFSSTIEFGKNFFGRALSAGDNSFDASNFATKVRSVGIWLEGYDNSKLAEAPRAYLIPVGKDVMYMPNSTELRTRDWYVKDQPIPVPIPISESDLDSSRFVPVVDSVMSSQTENRKHSSFRAYHDSGELKQDEMTYDSRLIGRSVWNTKWLLIIPGGTLLADGDQGLDTLIYGGVIPGDNSAQPKRDGNGVKDIKLFFQTYAHSGN